MSAALWTACDAQGKPRPNWPEYLPSDVNRFGGQEHNLAYLCEDSTVAILFDRNARIPLYAATVMTGLQLSAGGGGRPTNHFRKSKSLDSRHQQKAVDYVEASRLNVCFKKGATNTRAVDEKWAFSLRFAANMASLRKKAYSPKRASVRKTPVNICLPVNLKVTIHKGHLIASQYGRGDKERMLATFTFTNVVPQFGRFNSGPWQRCESNLIMWGRKNCATGKDNVKLFIVVGAIPSTVFGASRARFFGKKGFSDYQDEEDYPVNVPQLMWTAACCSFEYTDDQGNLQTGIKSIAFSGENVPGGQCMNINIPKLTTLLSGKIHGNINIFPLTLQCYNNYIPL